LNFSLNIDSIYYYYALLTQFGLTLLKRMLYSSKANVLNYDYQLCHAAITRPRSIKDLSVFFDSKLYFHNHVNFLFSECMKLLGLICSITVRVSALDCLYVLYFTFLRSKLECASVVLNSITSTDASKLEHIQQKLASIYFCRFSPDVFYSYAFALNK
jgi:hypothetical protein